MKNRSISLEGLKPYLILPETADKVAFETLMKRKGIPVLLKWRYYYEYRDAIRIIDFVETKGVYDAWVVFLPKDNQLIADELVQEYPEVLSYFAAAEEQFLRGLKTTDLIKSLASQRMTGVSLDLAKMILKEQEITFSEGKIAELKKQLLIDNSHKQVQVACTKLLIWLLIILVGVFYLWAVGFFN